MSSRASLALLSATLFAVGCTRSHTPTLSEEPRPRDASSALDAALDASRDAANLPTDARTNDASADGATDGEAPWRAWLDRPALVVSGQHDLPMRDPPAATPAAVRSGRAPSLGAAVAMLRSRRASAARFVPEGGFSALGDGRFALVVRRSDAGFRRSPAFEVHVFSENAGEAQLEGSAQIPTANLYLGESGSSGCPPAILAREVRDIDSDGEPELSLVLRYCLMANCVDGYMAYEYLVVYDVTPGPRLALMVERRMRGQGHMQAARSRTVTFRDLNGDGHPDAIARGRDCEPNYDRIQSYLTAGNHASEEDAPAMSSCEQAELRCADNPYGVRDCTAREETALYNPAADAWLPGTDGAERRPDVNCMGQPETAEGAAEE